MILIQVQRPSSRKPCYGEAITSSSAEFVRDRYAVQAIPMVDTNGCKFGQQPLVLSGTKGRTHDLELYRHDSEVQHLHQRPDHIIRLQSRNIYILKLPYHRSLPTTLCDRHECEETPQPARRKQQLIKHDPSKRVRGRLPTARDRKCMRQEAEPLVLHRRHDEPVCHEAHQALEVERGRF